MAFFGIKHSLYCLFAICLSAGVLLSNAQGIADKAPYHSSSPAVAVKNEVPGKLVQERADATSTSPEPVADEKVEKTGSTEASTIPNSAALEEAASTETSTTIPNTAASEEAKESKTPNAVNDSENGNEEDAGAYESEARIGSMFGGETSELGKLAELLMKSAKLPSNGTTMDNEVTFMSSLFTSVEPQTSEFEPKEERKDEQRKAGCCICDEYEKNGAECAMNHMQTDILAYVSQVTALLQKIVNAAGHARRIHANEEAKASKEFTGGMPAALFGRSKQPESLDSFLQNILSSAAPEQRNYLPDSRTEDILSRISSLMNRRNFVDARRADDNSWENPFTGAGMGGEFPMQQRNVGRYAPYLSNSANRPSSPSLKAFMQSRLNRDAPPASFAVGPNSSLGDDVELLSEILQKVIKAAEQRQQPDAASRSASPFAFSTPQYEQFGNHQTNSLYGN